MRFLGRAALAAAALGAYSFYEPYRFRLNSHQLAIAADLPPIKILHISDLHLTRRNRKLARFVKQLPSGDDIDLVLATGDMIEDDSGIEPLIDCFSHLKASLGCYYVLGSHDYHQSRFTFYSKYFKERKTTTAAPLAATDRLQAGLAQHGWKPLTNSSATLEAPWGQLRLVGLDDPYLRRHDVRVIQRDPEDRVAIGLLHSPDVVSEWFLKGFDLVLAGHTHAGQVRVPFYGALVTNCSLPARLAGGPHRIGKGWLHVSPGLGTGKFSPIRFNCLPEATLLELVPDS